jgi:hypothetical protein
MILECDNSYQFRNPRVHSRLPSLTSIPVPGLRQQGLVLNIATVSALLSAYSVALDSLKSIAYSKTVMPVLPIFSSYWFYGKQKHFAFFVLRDKAYLSKNIHV